MKLRRSMMKLRMIAPGICLAFMAMLMTPSTSRAYTVTVVNDCDYDVGVTIYTLGGPHNYIQLMPHTIQESKTGAWCFGGATGEWYTGLGKGAGSYSSFGDGYVGSFPRCFNFTIRVVNYKRGIGCEWYN